ncbi:hypothetical protein ACVI1L_002194 [Bradyrhizobium sp. USDA 4516]
MKMFVLAGALCLLLANSTVCKANSGPWCKLDVVTLAFKNQQSGILRRSNFAPSRQFATETRKRKGLG